MSRNESGLLTEVHRSRPGERFRDVQIESTTRFLVEICLELVLRRTKSELLAVQRRIENDDSLGAS